MDRSRGLLDQREMRKYVGRISDQQRARLGEIFRLLQIGKTVK